MSTYMPEAPVKRKWYIIDAAGKTLGRVATEAARLLRGKHKPIFTPNMDVGDHVVVINAAKVTLTGQKLQKKLYIHHSGYPGGFKVESYASLMQRRPDFAVEKAIKGMIPHNRLGRQMAKKLKVYRGADHPHQAQLPEAWPL